jgi:hypothetical protein
MKKNQLYLIVAVIAILAVAYVATNLPDINFQLPTYQPPTSNPTPSPTYNPYPTPTPYPTPMPNTDIQVPSSLYVNVDPSTITMKGWVYGEVTGNGRNYPIIVHAKHVGANTETSFGALLDSDGHFYHSQTIDLPGYWDFWATTDTGVTSNMPRLEVQGAMIVSNDFFFSRIMDDETATLQLFCHSSGTATVFANDPDDMTSTSLGTVHINSGGYAEFALDVSVLGLGTYEIDFVVNGIKASDYGESIWITYGR